MKIPLINPQEEKIKGALARRRRAYQCTFGKENQFGEIVLKDLAKFCRANESTFHADPRLHAVLEGRREVWLRICHHLHLDSDTMWKYYGKNSLE